MKVRRATRDDAAKIAEFAIALAEQHTGYDPSRFTRVITTDGAEWFYGSRNETDNAVVLVAELDGETIGFAYMTYEPVLYSELATKVAWLDDIYVVPEARGTSAGHVLLEEAKKEAIRFGANKILLTVAQKNAVGQQFFERNGFHTTMLEMMLPLV